MKNNNLLMLSLPNSGSTWLAAVIAKHLPGCRYYDMEFFNPLRNEKHEKELARDFGCELASCYTNIMKPSSGLTLEVIDKTWGVEDYNFTKEVFCPAKAAAFSKRFNMFGLLRSFEESFPPSRLRIWSFYEHAWWSMLEHGYAGLTATTYKGRAEEAHAAMYAEIMSAASLHKFEVIKYSSLFSDDPSEINETMARAIGFSSDQLVDEIIKTRAQKSRPAVAA